MGSDNDILIFERVYHCWLNGNYLGEATYTDDENVGPSFLRKAVNDTGELVNQVFMPDKYKLKD